MKPKIKGIEHFHISSESWGQIKSIDVYLDHNAKETRIEDSYNRENQIKITANDWNLLVKQIRSGNIGVIED